MIKAIQTNLSGVEALQLLQKGHMVRRACWVKDFLIRITNEEGFDSNGNAVYDEDTTLYTIATTGYFLHIGFSSQPFDFAHGVRAGEGIGMLFENDWEDHGFISAKDFDTLTEEVKERVVKKERRFIKSS